MREPRDLMERLAAADPLPDAERLTPEEQREADALLARLLATPAEPAVDAPRARPRRLALAMVGVAGTVAAAFVAINLVDSDGPAPGPGVVERAVAAVARGDAVYHVLERTRATGSNVPAGDRTIYFESWTTTTGRVHRKFFASNGGRRGRLLDEFAGRRRPGRRGGRMLRYDPRQNAITEAGFATGPSPVPGVDPFADPGAQLRALQEQGRLRVEGTTQVGGRSAYRLVSGPVMRPDAPRDVVQIEFLVDAETYLPLAQRYSTSTGSRAKLELFTRYLIYEQLPLDARSSARLALDAHPGATCSPSAGELRGDRDLGFRNPCR